MIEEKLIAAEEKIEKLSTDKNKAVENNEDKTKQLKRLSMELNCSRKFVSSLQDQVENLQSEVSELNNIDRKHVEMQTNEAVVVQSSDMKTFEQIKDNISKSTEMASEELERFRSVNEDISSLDKQFLSNRKTHIEGLVQSQQRDMNNIPQNNKFGDNLFDAVNKKLSDLHFNLMKLRLVLTTSHLHIVDTKMSLIDKDDEISDKQKTISDLNCQVDQLKTQESALNLKISSLDDAVEELAAVRLSLKEKNLLHSEQSEANNDLKVKNEQLKKLKEEFQELVEQARTQLDKELETNASLYKQVDELKVQVSNLAGNLKSAQQRCEEADEEKLEFLASNEELSANLNSKVVEIASLKDTVEIYERDFRDFENNLNVERSQKVELENNLKNITAEAVELRKRNQMLACDLREFKVEREKTLQSANETKVKLEKETSDLHDELKAKQEQLVETSSKINSVTEAFQALEAENIEIVEKFESSQKQLSEKITLLEQAQTEKCALESLVSEKDVKIEQVGKISSGEIESLKEAHKNQIDVLNSDLDQQNNEILQLRMQIDETMKYNNQLIDDLEQSLTDLEREKRQIVEMREEENLKYEKVFEELSSTLKRKDDEIEQLHCDYEQRIKESEEFLKENFKREMRSRDDEVAHVERKCEKLTVELVELQRTYSDNIRDRESRQIELELEVKKITLDKEKIVMKHEAEVTRMQELFANQMSESDIHLNKIVSEYSVLLSALDNDMKNIENTYEAEIEAKNKKENELHGSLVKLSVNCCEMFELNSSDSNISELKHVENVEKCMNIAHESQKKLQIEVEELKENVVNKQNEIKMFKQKAVAWHESLGNVKKELLESQYRLSDLPLLKEQLSSMNSAVNKMNAVNQEKDKQLIKHNAKIHGLLEEIKASEQKCREILKMFDKNASNASSLSLIEIIKEVEKAAESFKPKMNGILIQTQMFEDILTQDERLNSQLQRTSEKLDSLERRFSSVSLVVAEKNILIENLHLSIEQKKDDLEEKEKEFELTVQALNGTLQSKQEEISSLLENFNQKSIQFDDLTQNHGAKLKELESLKLQNEMLTNRKDEIEDNLAAKISTLEQLLSEKEFNYDELHTAYSHSSTKLDKLHENYSNLQMTHHELNLNFQEKKKETEASQGLLKIKQAALDELNGIIFTKNKEIDQLYEENGNDKNTICDLKEEINRNGEALSCLELRMRNKTLEIEELHKTLDENRKGFQAELSRKDKEINSLTASLNESQFEHEKIKNKLETALEELERSERELKLSRNEADSVQAELFSMKDEINDKQSELLIANSNLVAKEAVCNGLEHCYKEKEKEMKALEEKYKLKSDENKELIEEVQRIEQAVQNLNLNNSRLQNSLFEEQNALSRLQTLITNRFV